MDKLIVFFVSKCLIEIEYILRTHNETQTYDHDLDILLTLALIVFSIYITVY